METRILDIFEGNSDANIGQTLLRLANLASSSHRMEVARQYIDKAEQCSDAIIGYDSEQELTVRKDSGRIEGLDPRAASRVDACTSGASPVGTEAACLPLPNSGSKLAHTEVSR
jgi:hypothetical protein